MTLTTDLEESGTNTDADAEGGRSRLTSNTMVVAAGTAVSRVSGLGRVVIVAAVLGPTYFGNLFESANFIPNIVFVLLSGPFLVSFVVPHLVKRLAHTGVAGAGALIRSLTGFVLIAFSSLAALLALAGPLLLRLVTAGVDDPEVAADQRRLGSLLLLLVMPQVVLYGLAGLGAAAQNSRRRYAIASAAPALENLGVIATMLIFASSFGIGRPLDEVSTTEIVVLGLGSTAAVGMHCAVQVIGAARAGLPMIPTFSFGDRHFRAVIRDARSVAFTATLQGVRHMTMLVVAGIVPGGVVAFRMAFNFFNLPIALAAKPVAVAALPDMTLLDDGVDQGALRKHWYEALSLALFIAMPAGAAYVVLAVPIAHTFSYGEMATDRGVELLALSIAALGFGIAAAAVDAVATSASFAAGDAQTPLRAMIVRMSATGLGVALGVAFADGAMVLVALGLSFAAGDLAAASLVYLTVSARLGATVRDIRRPMVGTVTATIAMGTAAGAIVWSTRSIGDGRAGAFVVLVTAGLVGVAVYTAIQRSAGSNALFQLVPRLRPAVHDVESTPRPVGSKALDRGNPTIVAVGLLMAVVGAIVTPFDRNIAIALIAGIIITGLVLIKPVNAAYVYLGLTPLIAGLHRGSVVPVLRPSEALLLLLVGAVLLERLFRLMDGEPFRVQWGPLHGAFVALALAGSVIPLLWMTGQGRTPGLDDLLFAATLWKFFALYVLVRSVVWTSRQVQRCLQLMLGAHAAVGIVAIFQALGLFGVPGLLATVFPESIRDHANHRGSSLLDSSHAVGDTMTICLALVIALIARRGGRPSLVLFACFFLVAALASGQVSTIIGLGAGVAVAGVLTGQLAHISRTAVFGIAGGSLLLQQTVARRLDGVDEARGVPSSWLARWENLRTYFWPELIDGANLIFGVRPAARVPAPETWRDWIWIDSGLVWLLWTGGLPLLMTFVWFVARSIGTVSRVARTEPGPVGAAGVGAVAGLAVVASLMVLDAHLTLRGTADLLFPLLALATPIAWRSTMRRSHVQPQVAHIPHPEPIRTERV